MVLAEHVAREFMVNERAWVCGRGESEKGSCKVFTSLLFIFLLYIFIVLLLLFIFFILF